MYVHVSYILKIIQIHYLLKQVLLPIRYWIRTKGWAFSPCYLCRLIHDIIEWPTWVELFCYRYITVHVGKDNHRKNSCAYLQRLTSSGFESCSKQSVNISLTQILRLECYTVQYYHSDMKILIWSQGYLGSNFNMEK